MSLHRHSTYVWSFSWRSLQKAYLGLNIGQSWSPMFTISWAFQCFCRHFDQLQWKFTQFHLSSNLSELHRKNLLLYSCYCSRWDVQWAKFRNLRLHTHTQEKGNVNRKNNRRISKRGNHIELGACPEANDLHRFKNSKPRTGYHVHGPYALEQ